MGEGEGGEVVQVGEGGGEVVRVEKGEGVRMCDWEGER